MRAQARQRPFPCRCCNQSGVRYNTGLGVAWRRVQARRGRPCLPPSTLGGNNKALDACQGGPDFNVCKALLLQHAAHSPRLGPAPSLQSQEAARREQGRCRGDDVAVRGQPSSGAPVQRQSRLVSVPEGLSCRGWREGLMLARACGSMQSGTMVSSCSSAPESPTRSFRHGTHAFALACRGPTRQHASGSTHPEARIRRSLTSRLRLAGRPSPGSGCRAGC